MTARLPVIGSSAATTAFCAERLDGPGGIALHFDGNGKVTAGNGTLAAPKANALSLPAQGITDRLAYADPKIAEIYDNPEFGGSFEDLRRDDCPGSTPTCRRACYVSSLSEAQPELYALYEANAVAIREILADEYLANEWAMHVAHWITTNAPGGFRWHVSGDVFSMQYAEWIADVVRESPSVRSWIYTRSFDFIAPLVGVATINSGNLALNLSADVDNYAQAREARDTWAQDGGKPRICYLTVDGAVPDDLDEDDTVFPDYGLRPRQFKTFAESPWWQGISQFKRGLVCPVDAHSKSEKRRCGLDHCDRCLR